jgi:hypothetical protein
MTGNNNIVVKYRKLQELYTETTIQRIFITYAEVEEAGIKIVAMASPQVSPFSRIIVRGGPRPK